MPRVFAFPRASSAYTGAFYAALERQGVPVVEGNFSGRWLWRHLAPGDWVHLHWPSFAYAAPGVLATLTGFLRFAALLRLVRARGARIAWTAHNLLPHDPSPVPGIHRLGRHLVIRSAAAIFVHGAEARRVLLAAFPAAAAKTTVIPHGHWIDFYAPPPAQVAARAALGLPAAGYVFLFFGFCKPYKNLHRLVQVFRASTLGATLLVAGQFQSSEYRREVLALARGDARIRIDVGSVADDRVPVYLAAADAVVAPYRDILTSGTAMLAMGFGRPVVSVDRGFLRDVVTADTGVLYPPDDPAGLSRSLEAVMARRFNAEAIVAHARTFDFEAAARAFVQGLGGRAAAGRS